MNIHRYLLPATIAATVHVALLWFLPGESYTRIIAVAPPVEPPKPPNDITEPPEDKDSSTSADPVKPLLGKPAPVELDEPPITKLPERVFEMPVDPRPHKMTAGITTLPDKIGDPAGVPNGIDPSRMPIFSSGDLDGAPRAKVQLPPDYPYTMKQAGTSGSVTVEFDVDAGGRVVRAEAIRYTDREFAEPAVRAVKKWRFEPGKRNGKAVPFRMAVPIEFNIENS